MAKSWLEIAEGELPKIPFVMEPILPYMGKLMIFAPAWHYKSMMSMDILFDAAEGVDVLGKYPVPRPLRSMFVEQELGDLGTKIRCKRILQYRENPIAAGNIFILTKKREIRLDSEKGLKTLADEIEKHMPLDVVCLDPIRKFYRRGPDDEQSSTEITAVVEAMDAIIETYKVSIIFTHHAGHPGFMGKEQEHARGSSVWNDEPDGILRLSRVPSDKEIIRVHVQKLRHSEMPKPSFFDLEFDTTNFSFTRVKK